MEKVLAEQTKKRASLTKIVWTLGPESRSVEIIEKLLKAGMNIARFNFSHGSHEYHQETLDNLRTAIENTGILCAVMLDTKGPEIRTGFLKQGKPIELIQGREITISVDYTIEGDSEIISMSYKKLAEHLKPGDVILCSNGMISLTVLSCDKNLGLVRCRCENSAFLGERERVNILGTVVDLPILTEKDKEDILQWGVPNKIDIIALSFVRQGSDLDEVSELLGVHRKSIMLMSKIDNEESFLSLDEIMKKSDAVMVCRGDLAMEMPTWKVDRAQKRIMEKASALGKPIVTAIQTFEEVTDAVLNGTDCVMLNGIKAAIGSLPENAVQRMSSLCKEAEDRMDYEAVQNKIFKGVPRPLSPLEDIAVTAVMELVSITDPKAIAVVTKSGHTAELAAKYRPSVPIMSVVDPKCPESAARVATRGLVYRGIIPVIGVGGSKSTEEMIEFGLQVAKKEEVCNAGDLVLVLQMTRGCPFIVPLTVR